MIATSLTRHEAAAAKVVRAINTCKTLDHICSARHLINNYTKIFGQEDALTRFLNDREFEIKYIESKLWQLFIQRSALYAELPLSIPSALPLRA